MLTQTILKYIKHDDELMILRDCIAYLCMIITISYRKLKLKQLKNIVNILLVEEKVILYT